MTCTPEPMGMHVRLNLQMNKLTLRRALTRRVHAKNHTNAAHIKKSDTQKTDTSIGMDCISALTFFDFLLANAPYEDHVKQKMRAGAESMGGGAVTLGEFLAYFSLLERAHDLEVACDIMHAAGKKIDERTFNHLCVAVGAPLSANTASIAFKVMDINGDGALDPPELVGIIKSQLVNATDVDEQTKTGGGFMEFLRCVKSKLFA
eukprot:GDKI01030165.1.p1 GENE.GDKI01030165.1~~GDKI01030165.1.p1  ORF type:complete len:205 (+),score=63.95 GDKI01030165.1:50-664(+)